MNPSLFSSTGVTGQAVDRVLLIILGISVALLILITFLLVFFIVRYSRKRHPRPAEVKEHLGLEIAWTVAPTILVLAMFYYGVTGYDILRRVPRDAMVVHVTARQWSWLFTYENGLQSTTLRVPLGRPVKLLLNSQDVIHDFYVPAFRIKQDIVPGMETYLWFQATALGTYDVFCTQYCGLEHAHMLSKVEVISQNDFTAWYQGGKSVTGGLSAGAKLYQDKGCASCHSTDGAARVGPTFKGLFGSTQTVARDGKERTVTVDEAYLRNYLLEPNLDVVNGFPPIMPSQKGLLTDKEIEDLVEFIKESN
jgi:cytochrome c oxidase subunit 2